MTLSIIKFCNSSIDVLAICSGDKNSSSKEELSEKEARELYYGRWEIEKAFDIIKIM